VGSVEYVRRGLITGVLGRIILGGGVLILLFVAYQLWGTDIAESHSQAVLRERLEAQLHHTGSHPTTTTTTTAGPSSTTTTTTTATGDQPTVGPTIAAPDDGNPVGLLKIAKIGLDKVIVQGTSTNDLRQGPGHYPGTPLPGEQGNAAIAGHRTTYGAPFYNLDALAVGDPIVVTTVQGTFTYDVTGTVVVSPNDTSVVDNTTFPELTLTTCNPRFSASSRLVVHARLTTPPAPTATPPKATPKGESPATTSDLAGGQGDWTPALEQGVLVAFVITAVLVVARRRRSRSQRFIVYGVGGAVSLVVLFFFFGALSPLLPASF
jgi:sortase A